MFKIPIKKLDEIADVINGVRENRYKNQNTVSQKLFQLEKPDFELAITTEELSEDIDEKYYSKKGDLIINLDYPYEIFLIEDEDVIITSKFAIIRLNEGYDSNYIFQLLKSKKEVFSKLTGGFALKFLKIHDLKTIKLEVPNFKIQKQHGRLLNLIDKKIDKQQNLIETEINFKKSILGESNVKL